MNICIVCQADGVMQSLGLWYCTDHLEQGFLAVADYLAQVRGWSRDETRDQLQRWLAQ
jgi:hypothetical protein